MSGDRKSRRRFLADLLFAGGALTAASVLGYTATHTPGEEAAAATPTPAAPCPVTPVCEVPTDLQPPVREDLRPAGGARPVPQRPPQRPNLEVRPGGAVAVPHE